MRNSSLLIYMYNVAFCRISSKFSHSRRLFPIICKYVIINIVINFLKNKKTYDKNQSIRYYFLGGPVGHGFRRAGHDRAYDQYFIKLA